MEALQHAISVRDAGDQETALEEFRLLADKTADPVEKASLILNETNILIALRRFEEAMGSLQRARHIATDESSRAHADCQEALLSMWEGRPKDALRIYRRMLDEYPRFLADPEYRYLKIEVDLNIGVALAFLGRADEAIPRLNEALTYGIPDGRKAWVYYKLGVCFQIKKQEQRAIEAFQKAIQLSSDLDTLVGARYSLGVLYGKEGAWGKALQELEWCEQHFVPCDIPLEWVCACLAKILRAVGRITEAEKYQKRTDDLVEGASKNLELKGENGKTGTGKTGTPLE